jgi:hypothetical protein
MRANLIVYRRLPRQFEPFRTTPDRARGTLEMGCNRAGCLSFRHQSPKPLIFYERPGLIRPENVTHLSVALIRFMPV